MPATPVQGPPPAAPPAAAPAQRPDLLDVVERILAVKLPTELSKLIEPIKLLSTRETVPGHLVKKLGEISGLEPSRNEAEQEYAKRVYYRVKTDFQPAAKP